MPRERWILTNICNEICGDDPASLMETLKVIGNVYQSRAYNRELKIDQKHPKGKSMWNAKLSACSPWILRASAFVYR
jgi:hypothetical protein